MARPRRIVCYAINGSGLGHVTRLLGISRWMRRLGTFIDGTAPEIFFLSSSEAPQLTLEAGFPTFKLPSKTIARESGMDMLEYRRLAKHFIWNTLGVFRPDLLVVDTFPSGSFDELFQVLDGPFRKGLILREVKREYAARPMFRAALRLYDHILVPGETDAVERMALPEGLDVTPVGRLTHLDGEELLSKREARAALGVPQDGRVVYLSAGGGGDVTSAAMLSATAEALAALDCTVVIGAGPLYRGPKVYGPHVRWSTAPGLAKCFRGFDAAVSAAGYNTFHELMLARVPTVFVPQAKVADDQGRRVAAAVAAGAARSVARGEGDTPEDVARATSVALGELLADRAGNERMAAAMSTLFPSNNAIHCAARLLDGLYATEALARAVEVLAPEFVHALPSDLTTAEQADFLGRLLPALSPPDVAPGSNPLHQVQGLLSRLSESARAEVRAAVASEAADGWVGVVHQGVPRLVATAKVWGVSLREVAALTEVAMRKHPLAQEASQTHKQALWLDGLLTLITEVVAGGSDTATLYRYWPRIADADLRVAFALFKGFIEAANGSGSQAWELQRTLTGLKATVKRVTRADAEVWTRQVAQAVPR